MTLRFENIQLCKLGLMLCFQGQLWAYEAFKKAFYEHYTIADDEHEDEVDEQLPEGDLDVQLRVLVVLQHLPGCPHAWV